MKDETMRIREPPFAVGLLPSLRDLLLHLDARLLHDLRPLRDFAFYLRRELFRRIRHDVETEADDFFFGVWLCEHTRDFIVKLLHDRLGRARRKEHALQRFTFLPGE